MLNRTRWQIVEYHTVGINCRYNIYRNELLILSNLSYDDAVNWIYNNAAYDDLVTECYINGKVTTQTWILWQIIAKEQ